MDLTQENRLSLGLLLAVLVVNAVALWPELTAGRIFYNDNVSHFTLLEGIVQAVQRGENPLDFWSPECEFGFPIFRTYQPLADGVVALAYFALGKAASLMTLFVWARYLTILLVPAAFYSAALLLELPPLTAGAAAVLSPLIAAATGNPLGVELRSWLYFGVFPQCLGTSFLLVTLGLAFGAVRKGRHLALTGGLLGLTSLAHLIYGWMGALTICLLALMPDAAVPRRIRIKRTIGIGAVALVLTAFQLLPLLPDGYYLNHSHWEPAEKWDSFGAGKVLQWLFTGELMDDQRVPVLTLLSFLGAGMLLWRFRKTRKLAPAEAFLLLGAAFWLLVFFGRPTWGLLLMLLGATADLHLHRVNAGVQIFLLLLAALALSAIWREAARRWRSAAAVAITAVLLLPLVWERARFLSQHFTSGEQTLAAYMADQAALDGAISLVKKRGGRVYAGLQESWGSAFKIGAAPVAGFLSINQVPGIGFMYNSSALPSDLRFDELNPAAYRLFNVRSLLAPAMPGTPGFLKPVADFGRFRVLDAPGGGYFDVVDVAAAVPITRYSFYDVNDRWLHSAWVERKQHLWIEFKGPDPKASAPTGLPRISADSPLPETQAPAASPGTVASERQNGQVYEAEFEAARPSFVLFKMTWHANWKAYVDGKAQNTAMLSPGFLGVPVAPGRHRILCRYEPGNWKIPMGAAGFVVVGLLIAVESSRRRPPAVDSQHRAGDKGRLRRTKV